MVLTRIIIALKNYAKSLKYLAEDWAPPGTPLPEILLRAPPVNLDDVTNVPQGLRAQVRQILYVSAKA